MPEIQELCPTNAPLSGRFLQPDPDGQPTNTELLSSPRSLHLADVVLNDDDWNPLIPYLACDRDVNVRQSMAVFCGWLWTLYGVSSLYPVCKLRSCYNSVNS